MKYAVAWTLRMNGSETENEAAVRRGGELFSKWTPSASSTIHHMVTSQASSASSAITSSTLSSTSPTQCARARRAGNSGNRSAEPR
jgi:hypothetical protein